MLYSLVRAIVAAALRLFFRLKVNAPAAEPEGPVLFVANHPNGLVDPGLLFVVTKRQVTFLAKAPLFKLPVLGWLLKGLGALPVYRKQDDPTRVGGNEGTLEASREALVQGRALMLFPEGKSHSEPSLAELKTGAARIALGAARQGAEVKVVPVGFTYADKHLFRSEVLIEVGAPLEVRPYVTERGEQDGEAVRRLTERMAGALKEVTVNLQEWEDLALVRLAEQLYAVRQGEAAEPERLRYWARGLQLFRAEQPERFEQMRREMLSLQRRLGLMRAEPEALVRMRERGVALRVVLLHVVRLLVGLPVFALGWVLFYGPYLVPRWLSRKAELDVQATVKVLAALVIAPVWWGLLTVVGWVLGGWVWGLVALVGVPPLALYTLAFSERWEGAWRDMGVFFSLGNRERLKARLVAELERLAGEVERLAGEYRPRLEQVVNGG